MPGGELPRLESHFARKKEGGVYDFLRLSAGKNRGYFPGSGRGYALEVPRARIMHVSGRSVDDSDVEEDEAEDDEEVRDAEETENAVTS